MTMRNMVVVCALVCGLGLLHWVNKPVVSQARAAIAPSPSATGDESDAPSRPHRPTGPTSVRSTLPLRPEPAQDGAHPETEVRLRFVFSDSAALGLLAPPPLDGLFSFGQAGHEDAEVEVLGAECTLRACLGEPLLVRTLTLGARAVEVGVDEVRITLGGPPVEVPVHWQSGVVLHVLDRETGEHLTGVEVVTGRLFGARLRGSEYQCPPASAQENTVVRDGSSPFTMPSMVGSNTFWARAPERARARFSIEGDGGIRRVRLGPASQLDVETAPAALSRGAGVVVRVFGGPSLSTLVSESTLDSQGRASFGSIPPQSGVVVVERTGAIPRVLGRSAFEAAEGQTARVVVNVTNAYAFGSIRCQLTLSEPHVGEPPMLLLYPVGDSRGGGVPAQAFMDEVVAGSSYFSSLEGMPLGKFALEIKPLGLSRLLEVRAGESTEVEFEVPAFARADVWVTDLESGEVLREATASFLPTGLESVRQFVEVSLSNGSGSFVRAPGAGALVCSAPGYASERLEIELLPGPNTFAFELAPAGEFEFEVRLLTDGARLPLGWDFWVGLEVYDEDAERQPFNITSSNAGSSREFSNARFTASRSRSTKTYTVRFPRVDGFEPVSDQVLETAASSPVLVVILEPLE